MTKGLEKKKEGYGYLINRLIGLGDVILINLSFVVLYFLFFRDDISFSSSGGNHLAVVFLLINLIYFITAGILPTLLSSNIIFFDKVIQRSVSFISLYFILLTAGLVLFGFDGINPGRWIVPYLGLVIIYTSWHVVIRSILKWYRRKGYNYKRIVIVGEGGGVLNVFNEMKSGDYGYKILGNFNDNKESLHKNLPYLGKIDEVEAFCKENYVDEIFCTIPASQERTIIRLVNFSERNMVRFFLVPEFYDYLPRKLTLNFLQTIPVIGLRPEPLQHFYNRIIKRTFDIIFSLIVLTTVFPVILIIFGSLIKATSKGPIFFRQKRTGWQGKVFTCYKFRSMKVNEYSDSKTTSEIDSRITPIGRFMRRTSIDELPQFFNVLIGNMSVVGPRPHMLKQTDLYNNLIDKFMVRHIVKPGITGWAQISGYRGETKTIEQMEGRLKRDVWYIENWSFILDIKIIVVTVFQVLKGDNNAF